MVELSSTTVVALPYSVRLAPPLKAFPPELDRAEAAEIWDDLAADASLAQKLPAWVILLGGPRTRAPKINGGCLDW